MGSWFTERKRENPKGLGELKSENPEPSVRANRASPRPANNSKAVLYCSCLKFHLYHFCPGVPLFFFPLSASFFFLIYASASPPSFFVQSFLNLLY